MKVTIVAEIASNWEGSVTKAKKLIKECKKAGADAVKFQVWRATDLYNKKHPNWKEIKKSELTFKKIKKIKDFSDKNNACLLALDQIEDPQNFGQIIRTAECAGIDAIIFPRHHSANISDTVLQVSQGAFINMPLIEVTNLKNTFSELKLGLIPLIFLFPYNLRVYLRQWVMNLLN